jgi:hypothetical protein
MIYDCFTFFNELELLELRLHELDSVVDRFVLVESTRSHSNQPKPLYFEDNKSQFERFLPKIEHIVVSNFPTSVQDRWVLENFQREAIMRGLRNCRPEDVVIVSDIDEVVSAQAVIDYKDKPGVKFFRQRLYYYFLNCNCVGSVWDRAKMVFFRDLRSPQWLRDYPGPSIPNPTRRQKKWAKFQHKLSQALGTEDIFIDQGGWHFSYLGGVDRIKLKIHSFAHAEYDSPEFLESERLLQIIERGEDLYGRKDQQYKFVPLDHTFPHHLLEHTDRFQAMIRPCANQERRGK